MGHRADVEWLTARIAPQLSAWSPSVAEAVLVELTMQWLDRLLPRERDDALRAHHTAMIKRHIAEPRLTVPEVGSQTSGDN